MTRGRRHAYLALLVLLLIGLGPIISLLIAGTIAEVNGCALDEGGRHPCLVLGVDLGEMLYLMAASFWFSFLTLPLAALATLSIVVMGLTDLIRRLNR
ncbi:hypothetical protein [Phaeovulum veldkampii]|uniref:hypothetical protein n=1 Tax=Phaeovulum veldkampii TaxID=33049 RepID=UPI00105E5745|nr:hypothetical protein [Phaeovulum veldkampii]NCU20845.1 hypothetical protein [Candidatus Falkowbacteria bacterium]TDQ56351.1 hypothetical protein EV658_11931 [Phaeovulum veldkampii DSM 11550]